MNHREIFFRHLAQTSPAPLALEIERAEGVFLYDTNKKSYYDLISGIGVSNIGHRHPEVVNAIKDQLDKYLHLMVYGEYIQAPQVQLAEALCDLLPACLDSVYFVNSGSEAVEGALKLAKRFSGRSRIVSFRNAYHGSSHGALSVMGSEVFKQAFRPLLPDVCIAPYNDEKSIDLINSKTAAVIIELIQGEAGVRIPSQEFIQRLSEKCRHTGTMLIADEIQTGLGRTGKMFAFEHFSIIPDVLLLAKSLGGGLPMGAFVASQKIMHTLSFEPVLGHITTFGGNPVCCAAALATVRLITRNRLHEQAEGKACHFRNRLALHPAVKDFRNMGLMMAIDMKNEEQVQSFVQKCLDRGVIVDWFLFSPASVRIAPPLTITNEEIQDACSRMLQCLEEIENG